MKAIKPGSSLGVMVYGCQDYSLEMQLLQLKRRQLVETDPQALRRLEARIEEIENNLGM